MRGPLGPQRGKRLGSLGLVERAGVAVQDGRVTEVGPTSRLRAKYDADEIVDAENGLVTPGFVDPHTHLPFAGDRSVEIRLKLEGRSYQEIARSGGGIQHTAKATRKATLADLTRLVRERARIMLEWGTTTIEAKSGYGLSWPHEEKQLRAIRAAAARDLPELVPTFLGAHIVPDEAPRARSAWIDNLCTKMMPRVAKGRLAEFADVFLDRGAYTRAEAKRILQAAQRVGLGLKLHADEFENRKGAELAAELGATSCEHLLNVSAAGIRALGRSATVAVLLPGVASLGFLDHQAPARRLLAANAAIALGTDFNPNCPVFSMPTVLQWGVYELGLTPAESLAAATTNAASAVGRGDKVGRIEEGFHANLLIHHYQTVDELAYWVGPNPVRTVILGGRVGKAN
jgi:imidazolonepropionase